MGVHNDDGADAVPEGLLGGLLNIDVDRQDDILARARWLLDDGTGDGALGRNGREHAAALARQNVVELLLDAEGADHVTGAVALRLELLKLLGGDLRHVADDVGRRVAVGVDPSRLLSHDHAELGEGVELIEVRLLRGVWERRYRDEVIGGQVCLHLGANVALGHPQRGCQSRDKRLLVRDKVGHESHDGEAGVHGEIFAVAVEDRAAPRRLGEEMDQATVVELGEDE